MRALLVMFPFLFAACTPAEPPPLSPPATSTAWFICDAIDAPVLLLFERNGDVVRVSEYDKPSGAVGARSEYAAAAVEGAAGSAYTTLRRNGAEAGVVRQLNPGMLESPGAAYTAPFASVRLGQREVACRWLPRTRVSAFTGRRSVVVHEDADGDLIYTSYDFADVATAQTIELSGNARTTTFSTEVRGGDERLSGRNAEFRFDAASGYTYVVRLAADGGGALQVLRDGAVVQDEPLIAYHQGAAEE